MTLEETTNWLFAWVCQTVVDAPKTDTANLPLITAHQNGYIYLDQSILHPTFKFFSLMQDEITEEVAWFLQTAAPVCINKQLLISDILSFIIQAQSKHWDAVNSDWVKLTKEFCQFPRQTALILEVLNRINVVDEIYCLFWLHELAAQKKLIFSNDGATENVYLNIGKCLVKTEQFLQHKSTGAYRGVINTNKIPNYMLPYKTITIYVNDLLQVTAELAKINNILLAPVASLTEVNIVITALEGPASAKSDLFKSIMYDLVNLDRYQILDESGAITDIIRLNSISGLLLALGSFTSWHTFTANPALEGLNIESQLVKIAVNWHHNQKNSLIRALKHHNSFN